MLDGVKIVAFLQNQWFKDPERVRAMIARHPEMRNQLLTRFLFAGCPTGKKLGRAFGDLCGRIVWENASPLIGGQASSKFPADLDHIRGVLEAERPDVVLAFGAIAQGGVAACWRGRVLNLPHPTARGLSNAAVDGWMPALERLLAEAAGGSEIGASR